MNTVTPDPERPATSQQQHGRIEEEGATLSPRSSDGAGDDADQEAADSCMQQVQEAGRAAARASAAGGLHPPACASPSAAPGEHITATGGAAGRSSLGLALSQDDAPLMALSASCVGSKAPPRRGPGLPPRRAGPLSASATAAPSAKRRGPPAAARASAAPVLATAAAAGGAARRGGGTPLLSPVSASSPSEPSPNSLVPPGCDYPSLASDICNLSSWVHPQQAPWQAAQQRQQQQAGADGSSAPARPYMAAGSWPDATPSGVTSPCTEDSAGGPASGPPGASMTSSQEELAARLASYAAAAAAARVQPEAAGSAQGEQPACNPAYQTAFYPTVIGSDVCNLGDLAAGDGCEADPSPRSELDTPRHHGGSDVGTPRHLQHMHHQQQDVDAAVVLEAPAQVMMSQARLNGGRRMAEGGALPPLAAPRDHYTQQRPRPGRAVLKQQGVTASVAAAGSTRASAAREGRAAPQPLQPAASVASDGSDDADEDRDGDSCVYARASGGAPKGTKTFTVTPAGNLIEAAAWPEAVAGAASAAKLGAAPVGISGGMKVKTRGGPAAVSVQTSNSLWWR